MEKIFYVYIIRCYGDRLYTGISSIPEKRFKHHKDGKGAKFTRTFKPISIEALWEAKSRSDALKLEAFIKSLAREKKLKLIANPFILQEMVASKHPAIFISVAQFKTLDISLLF